MTFSPHFSTNSSKFKVDSKILHPLLLLKNSSILSYQSFVGNGVMTNEQEKII